MKNYADNRLDSRHTNSGGADMPKKKAKKPKTTKRYNEVYDPEYDPSAGVMLANEMTGAVPAKLDPDCAEEALEDIAAGVNFYTE